MDVLVLNYNDAQTTGDFLSMMRRYACVQTILIVDNCSTDDSFARLQALADDRITVIKTDRNGGYGYGNNFGIRYLQQHGRSDYILLANPDTVISEAALVETEAFLATHPDFALAAPFMCDAKGKRQINAAFRVGSRARFLLSISCLTTRLSGGWFYPDLLQQQEGEREVEALSGSLFMMRRADMLTYGMFDENLFLYCEETVLGLKMRRAGKKLALLTGVEFIHNHSVSISKTYKSIRKRNRILQKSRSYVLRNYYGAGAPSLLLARLLGALNTLEEALSTRLKGKKGKKGADA